MIAKLAEAADQPHAYLPIPTELEYQEICDAIPAYEALFHPTPAEEVAAMYGAIALMFPTEKALTEEDQDLRLKMYVRSLKDLPKWALQKGFEDAAKNCSFFPKVSEIRAYAAAASKGRTLTLFDLKRLKFKHELEFEPPKPPEPPLTAVEITEGNRMMRRLGLRTRMNEAGESYLLEPGDEDPAGPLDEPEAEAA